jgi:microcystin-dependent protein
MPISLGNNASAHLSAPLAADGDTIVLVTAEMGNFPGLTAGQWFPLTLVDSAGHMEITKVTARAGNILTALRGQEGTSARAWLAGDRAEIRLTAAAIAELVAGTQDVADDLAAYQTSNNAAVAANTSAIAGKLATSSAGYMRAAGGTLQIDCSGTDPVLTKDGSAAGTLATQAYVDGKVAALQPELTGAVKLWPGASLPTGYLWCDGSAVSRTTYAALFSAIGTAHGAGNGSTTFNLPDLRGRMPLGKDDMGGTAANRVTSGGSGIAGATLGATGGAETVTLAASQIPAHSHTATTSLTSVSAGTPAGTIGAAGTHNHTATALKAGAGTGQFVSSGNTYGSGTITTDTEPDHTHAFTGSALAAHTHTATTTVANSTGGGGAHSNMPPSIVLAWIIKT